MESRIWRTINERRLARRRVLAGGAVLGAGAASTLLVGCGDDDDDAPAPTTAPAASAPTTAPAAPTAAAAASPAAAAKPVPRGEIRMALVTLGDQSSDPHKQNAGNNIPIINSAFEQLSRVGLDGKLTAGIAMSEEESPDHTTISFKIDPAARFWDGSKVTAEDVVWSYERWTSQKPPDSGANNAIQLLESVTAPDSSTVVVKFKAPNTLRLRGGVHAPRGWNIASRAYYDKVGEESFRKIPMATGPYKILANEPQAYVELEAIDNHWALSPQIEKIRMELVAEQATRIARLQTGEAAFADGVLGPQLAMLEADNNLQVYESKASAKATIYFHSPDVAPYSDQRFRKALGLLIDQPTIIKTLFQGHGTPSPSAHMFPSLDIWDDKIFPAQAFDPEQARKLLAEAGYANGAKVKFNFYDSSSAPLIPDTSLAIANMWRKEKIEVDLQQTEAGAYFEKYRAKTIGDIAVLGSGSGTAGEGYLITFYASPAAYGAPVPQDMQDAIRALSQEFDEEKHTEKTRAIYKRIIDEAWSITMPWGNSIWVARKDKIKDWKVFPANGYPASFYTMVPA